MNARSPLFALAFGLAACASDPAPMMMSPPPAPPPPPPPPPDVVIVDVRPRNVDAQLVERTPDSLAQLTFPMGVAPAVPWVDREGRGWVVTRDARFFTVDPYGAVTAVERLANDRPTAMESPPAAVAEVTGGEPMAFVPDGALVARDGTYQRAALPSLLNGAKAFARWGAEALWATGEGLYTTQGPRWLRLDRAGMPLRDVVALAPGPSAGDARDAWVLRGNGELYRVRTRAGANGALDVTWSDPAPGLTTGRVNAIATFGAHRYLARELDMLRVGADDVVERVRVPGAESGPAAMTPAGPWLWLAWGGGQESALGRWDGTRVEVLARGIFAQQMRLAADGARGDIALLLDGARVRRVVAEASPLVAGFADGAVVMEPRLPLQVFPPVPADVMSVAFTLDSASVERVNAAPFRWGAGGAELFRAFPNLMFGAHTAEAVITYRNAPELRVRRAFRYVSPLGRVPTYRADIAPLYERACARCHSTNIARDLRGYSRLTDMAPIIANVVQTRRMPPDLTLEPQAIQLVTAWVAGGAPE